ncbi:SfnB family sulfur acquisition oxidoreductase [Alteromonas gracilis]
MSILDEHRRATGATGPVPVLSTPTQARQAARAVAERAATGAAVRDRDRTLPYPEVAALAASGLLGITVPTEYGGPGLAPSVVAEVIATLAEADANLAQIPHSHFVYVNFLRVAGTQAQREELFGRVLEGALLANAQSERGGATIRDISTTLRPDGQGGLRLDGEKFYCTGTLFADVIPVMARVEDPSGESGLAEGEHIVFVSAVADGLSISDDWDAVGQRTTASGTVRLDGVRVERHQAVPRAGAFDGPNGYGAYAQLLHAAIEVGIARGALAQGATFVRDQARPWFEAGVATAAEDPLTIQRAGELTVDAFAAEAALERAGRSVDRVFELPTEAASLRATLDVAATKVVAERAALRVTEGLFELGGTRSAGAGRRLDRFWRNARTHSLHDPSRWKLQHLGRHTLTGQIPPRHGQL